jgi:nitroreductase
MLSLIKDRKSTVCFDQRPIPLEVLTELFEAVRWAPSAYNEQPWSFIIGIKGSSSYDKIFDSIDEGNLPWAKNAPVLIVSVAKSNLTHNNKPNPYAWHDTGMAYSNLLFQATALNLCAHAMAGFSAQTIQDNFNIPSGFQPIIVAAIGYKGTCNNMPQSLVERENKIRNRKEIGEFVFSGQWNYPMQF